MYTVILLYSFCHLVAAPCISSIPSVPNCTTFRFPSCLGKSFVYNTLLVTKSWQCFLVFLRCTFGKLFNLHNLSVRNCQRSSFLCITFFVDNALSILHRISSLYLRLESFSDRTTCPFGTASVVRLYACPFSLLRPCQYFLVFLCYTFGKLSSSDSSLYLRQMPMHRPSSELVRDFVRMTTPNTITMIARLQLLWRNLNAYLDHSSKISNPARIP